MRNSKTVDLIPDNFGTLAPADQIWLQACTASDFKDWEKLGARCTRCRRLTWLSKFEISKNFGGAKLVDLQPFLQCSVCGNKGENRFVVGKMARD